MEKFCFSADLGGHLLPFYFSKDICGERVGGQNDSRVVDLYSYLELENLMISKGIPKKSTKRHPPSLRTVTLTTTTYMDAVCALTSLRC